MIEERPGALIGREVGGAFDEPIGSVEDARIDEETGAARWLVVAGRLVPAHGAGVTYDDLVVPSTVDQVVSGADAALGVQGRTARLHDLRPRPEMAR